MNQELIGDWLIQQSASSSRKKGEAVAEPTGTMDVVGVSRVNPQLKAIAVIQTGFSTPDCLLLALHSDVEKQSAGIPAGTQVGK